MAAAAVVKQLLEVSLPLPEQQTLAVAVAAPTTPLHKLALTEAPALSFFVILIRSQSPTLAGV